MRFAILLLAGLSVVSAKSYYSNPYERAQQQPAAYYDQYRHQAQKQQYVPEIKMPYSVAPYAMREAMGQETQQQLVGFGERKIYDGPWGKVDMSKRYCCLEHDWEWIEDLNNRRQRLCLRITLCADPVVVPP